MKYYKSRDVFLAVPGRGNIYVMERETGDPRAPRHGDIIKLDGKEVRVATISFSMRPDHFLLTVDEINQHVLP